MNWDRYRREDGTIHLAQIAIDRHPFGLPDSEARDVEAFLNGVEAWQPIVSRQLAALAITTAYWLAKGRK